MSYGEHKFKDSTLGMIIANLNVAIMESNIFFDYMHAYATADIISGWVLFLIETVEYFSFVFFTYPDSGIRHLDAGIFSFIFYDTIQHYVHASVIHVVFECVR